MTMVNDFSRAKTLSDVSAEFNPYMQLKRIADYERDERYTYTGATFESDVTPLDAVRIMSALTGLKPEHRIQIDQKMVTDQDFFENVKKFVAD